MKVLQVWERVCVFTVEESDSKLKMKTWVSGNDRWEAGGWYSDTGREEGREEWWAAATLLLCNTSPFSQNATDASVYHSLTSCLCVTARIRIHGQTSCAHVWYYSNTDGGLQQEVSGCTFGSSDCFSTHWLQVLCDKISMFTYSAEGEVHMEVQYGKPQVSYTRILGSGLNSLFNIQQWRLILTCYKKRPKCRDDIFFLNIIIPKKLI